MSSVIFQVHVSGNIYSQAYRGPGGCSRAEAKKLLDKVYNEACQNHRSLSSNTEFRNTIKRAKEAIDRASGGASAASNRGFYNKRITTSAGYVLVDIEIDRGNGHFRS